MMPPLAGRVSLHGALHQPAVANSSQIRPCAKTPYPPAFPRGLGVVVAGTSSPKNGRKPNRPPGRWQKDD